MKSMVPLSTLSKMYLNIFKGYPENPIYLTFPSFLNSNSVGIASFNIYMISIIYSL